MTIAIRDAQRKSHNERAVLIYSQPMLPLIEQKFLYRTSVWFSLYTCMHELWHNKSTLIRIKLLAEKCSPTPLIQLLAAMAYSYSMLMQLYFFNNNKYLVHKKNSKSWHAWPSATLSDTCIPNNNIFNSIYTCTIILL